MNIDFTRYNFITGKIESVGSCDVLTKYEQATTGEEHISEGERIDGTIWFMPDGVKTLRPDLGIDAVFTITADGLEAVDLTFPVLCDIESLPDGEMWTGETELFLSSEEQMTRRFRIYPAFPYKVMEVAIHAV